MEVARWAWPRWRAHRIAAAARGGEPMATKARAAYWGGVAGGMAGQAWGGGTWTLRCSLRVCVCVCTARDKQAERERELRGGCDRTAEPVWPRTRQRPMARGSHAD